MSDELPRLVRDPAIAQAYNDVRSDSSGKTWLVLKYKNKQELEVEATGSGGVEQGAKLFTDSEAKFGFFKLNFDAPDGTKRTKFYLATWLGPSASVLVKGNMSVHKPIVKKVLKEAAVEQTFSEIDKVTNDNFIAEIKRVNY